MQTVKEQTSDSERKINGLKEKAIEKIAQFKQELLDAYQTGYHRANYEQSQAGLMAMYSCFNTLIPVCFRHNLSFPECLILNEIIIHELKKIV